MIFNFPLFQSFGFTITKLQEVKSLLKEFDKIFILHLLKKILSIQFLNLCSQLILSNIPPKEAFKGQSNVKFSQFTKKPRN